MITEVSAPNNLRRKKSATSIGAAFSAVALIVAEIASSKIAAARKADVFAAS